MAGDRRATMGNLIASRDIEKVHPADAYSLVGIAGTAGIGIELMRLFQVELEHYEKIEGAMLSLDGKANRLAAMIRGNLGAAMQGLAVVPLFAGFDLAADRPGAGRPHLQLRRRRRPLRGDRLRRDRLRLAVRQVGAEEAVPRRRVSAEDAIRLAVEALYDAADDDTATGGPDLTRKIYPVVMTATAEGTHRLTDEPRSARWPRRSSPARWRTRAADPPPVRSPHRDRLEGVRHPWPCSSTPSPEQIMRDRSEYARKGIARGRSAVVLTLRRRRAVRRREPVHRAAQDQRDLRPDRLRRGRPLQRVREPAPRRRADGRPQRPQLRPARRDRAGAGQRVRADARRDLHRDAEAVRGGDLRRAGRARTPDDDELYRITYDGSVQDEPGFMAMGGQAEAIADVLRDRHDVAADLADGAGAGRRGAGQRRRRERRSRARWPPTSSRWRCWTGAARAARSAGSPARR